MIAIEKNIQPKPVRNPAISPYAADVFVPMNIARLKAMMNEKRKDKPKTSRSFRCIKSSLVKLFAAIHGFSKIEYQRPPIKNVDDAAASIAIQLRCEIVSSISIVIIFYKAIDTLKRVIVKNLPYMNKAMGYLIKQDGKIGAMRYSCSLLKEQL
jgi:hypothetical protein